MKFSNLAIAMALFANLGCLPMLLLPSQPPPFQAMPKNDPDAVIQLDKEDNRLFPGKSEKLYSQVLDRLLKMGCTVTASDSSAQIVTFERSQREPETPKVHKGYGYDSAILIGTIRLSQESQGTRCTLVLTGKVNWRTENGTAIGVIPRLSPDEHKKFLDELFSNI